MLPADSTLIGCLLDTIEFFEFLIGVGSIELNTSLISLYLYLIRVFLSLIFKDRIFLFKIIYLDKKF